MLPGRLTSPLQGRSVWRSQRLRWTGAKDALSIEHSCNRFTDCGLWCVRTSAQIRVWNKRRGFISLSDHLPLDLCPTENKRRTTATCKSYCDHLKDFICFPCGWLRSGFSSEGITIPNKLSLFCCDEEFPPDNVNRSIYPSRKNGADFVGECILSGDQNAPWFIQLIESDCCSPWMQETNSSRRRYEILDMKNENRAAMSMLNWCIVTFFSLYETCSSTYSLISWVNFSHFFNSCVVCLLVNFGAKSSSEKEF